MGLCAAISLSGSEALSGRLKTVNKSTRSRVSLSHVQTDALKERSFGSVCGLGELPAPHTKGSYPLPAFSPSPRKRSELPGALCASVTPLREAIRRASGVPPPGPARTIRDCLTNEGRHPSLRPGSRPRSSARRRPTRVEMSV